MVRARLELLQVQQRPFRPISADSCGSRVTMDYRIVLPGQVTSDPPPGRCSPGCVTSTWENVAKAGHSAGLTVSIGW